MLFIVINFCYERSFSFFCRWTFHYSKRRNNDLWMKRKCSSIRRKIGLSILSLIVNYWETFLIQQPHCFLQILDIINQEKTSPLSNENDLNGDYMNHEKCLCSHNGFPIVLSFPAHCLYFFVASVLILIHLTHFFLSHHSSFVDG